MLSSVKKRGKPGRNRLMSNKENRLINCATDAAGEGGCPIIKDLSNPLSFTLNQRAVGSTPTRPPKIIN